MAKRDLGEEEEERVSWGGSAWGWMRLVQGGGGGGVVLCEWMRPQKSKAGNTSHYKHNSLPGLAVSVTGITLGELRDGLRFVGML